MKVHLIRDYSVPYSMLKETIELLNLINGPINFIEHEYSVNSIMDLHSFGSAHIRVNELYKKYILKPEKLFETCQQARDEFDIKESEIVILLTAFNNTDHLFSHFNQRNAFIFVRNWDLFIDTKEIYSFTYQVIEKIFQIILFETNDIMIKHLHEKPISCINDFCKEQSEVIYKLNSGNICQQCMKLAMDKNIDSLVLKQIISSIRFIRDSISGYTDFLNQPPKLTLQILDNFNLYIKEVNAEIKLNPAEKTLYYFFLEHEEGVEFNYLSEYSEEIYDLYNKFSTASNLASISKYVKRLTDPLDNSFNEKLSRIKSKFIKYVPIEQARHYIPLKSANEKKYMISISRTQFESKTIEGKNKIAKKIE